MSADLADRLALSMLRWKYGPLGWRVFRGDKGHWFASTTQAEVRDYNGRVWTGCPALVGWKDTPADLATELRRRIDA